MVVAKRGNQSPDEMPEGRKCRPNEKKKWSEWDKEKGEEVEGKRWRKERWRRWKRGGGEREEEVEPGLCTGAVASPPPYQILIVCSHVRNRDWDRLKVLKDIYKDLK